MNINDVTKFKILDVLKDKEDLTIWRRFLRADDNQCFECSTIHRAQAVSIAKKHVEQGRYEIVSRTLDVLFSSIGRGIEEYIIGAAHKVVATLGDFEKVNLVALVASPKLMDYRRQNSHRIVGWHELQPTFNNVHDNYSLKDNQFINHNSEWMYSVSEDVVELTDEGDKYVITGKIALAMSRIHVQEVGQMSEVIG